MDQRSIAVYLAKKGLKVKMKRRWTDLRGFLAS
jgi:hypothetical protein